MTLLRIYSECLTKTLKALARSPWTLLLPMVYLALLTVVGGLLAPLGLVGGFLTLIARDLLFASFLYVVAELVRGSPVRLSEMPSSIRPFFWPIINVLFVLWIADLFVRPLLASSANAFGLELGITAILFVVLNAVPEIIYQKQVYGGLSTIGASVSFIQENWIEWFIPNVLFGAALWFGMPLLAAVPLGSLAAPVAIGAFAHFAMIFRGFLFEVLDGSTARQRAMRYRMGR
jgi:hypothetical protein